MKIFYLNCSKRVPENTWLVLGLGSILRLALLDHQSLRLDESLSLWKVNRPWDDLLRYLSGSIRPLHYLVLHQMAALGGSEWLLRLPSALAGILTILLFFILSAELFDRKTARLAALILAISPFHIWYSQEARFYALVAALLLSSALFTLRGLQTNQWKYWILAGVFQGLAFWTETAAVWLFLGLNTALLLQARSLWQSKRLLPWILSQSLAVMIYLPAVPFFFGELQENSTSWIPFATLTALARLLTDFAGSFNRTPLEARLVLVWLVFVSIAGFRAILREVQVQRFSYIILFCWLGVPLGVSFLISQNYFQLPLLSLFFSSPRSVFLPRNLIVVIFPLFLLLARSLALSGPWRRTALVLALFLLNGVAYAGNSLSDQKENYRAAAQVVAEHQHRDSLILFAPAFLEAPFAYYYHRVPMQENRVPVEKYIDGMIIRNESLLIESPLNALDSRLRVWLITNTNVYQQDQQGIHAALKARGRLIHQWNLDGINVWLFDLSRPAPISSFAEAMK